MKTSELLDGAADVIERNGWVQGDWWESQTDDKGVDLDPRDCPVCPRSAIAVAAGRDPIWKASIGSPRSLGESRRADWDVIEAAEMALARYLGATNPEGIERWADDPGRTLPQILGAMRAAAQAEREAGR